MQLKLAENKGYCFERKPEVLDVTTGTICRHWDSASSSTASPGTQEIEVMQLINSRTLESIKMLTPSSIRIT